MVHMNDAIVRCYLFWHRQDDYCHLNMASTAFAWIEQSFAYFKTYMLYWVVIPHELLARFVSFHVLKIQSESF